MKITHKLSVGIRVNEYCGIYILLKLNYFKKSFLIFVENYSFSGKKYFSFIEIMCKFDNKKKFL